jgi:hypothetical protein
MRKESLITLTLEELISRHERELAWWQAANAPKRRSRKSNTRTQAKKNTPAQATAPAKRTPTTAANVDARMEELRAKYGLAWDEQDLAIATAE